MSDATYRLQRLSLIGKVGLWSTDKVFKHNWRITFKPEGDEVLSFSATGLTISEAVDNLLSDMAEYLKALEEKAENLNKALKELDNDNQRG